MGPHRRDWAALSQLSGHGAARPHTGVPPGGTSWGTSKTAGERPIYASPPPPQSAHHHGVCVPDPPGDPLPVAQSIALGWTLSGLGHWKLVSEKRPRTALPPGPISGAGQCSLVLSPTSPPPGALLAHAPEPHEFLLGLGPAGLGQQFGDLHQRHSPLLPRGPRHCPSSPTRHPPARPPSGPSPSRRLRPP